MYKIWKYANLSDGDDKKTLITIFFQGVVSILYLEKSIPVSFWPRNE